MGALYSPVSVLLTIIRIEYMYTLYVSLLQHRVPWQWLVIVILKQEIHHRQPQNTVCSAQHPARPPKSGYHKTLSVRPSTQPVLPKSGYHKTLSVHPSTQPVLTRVATTKPCLFGPAPSPSSQEWLPQNTVCSAQHPAHPPKSGYHKTLSVQPSTQPVLTRVATTKHCLFGPAPSPSSQEWLPQNTVCLAQHPTCLHKSGYHKTLSVRPSTQPVLPRVATTKHCLFGPAPNLSSQEWLPQNTVCLAQHPTCLHKSGYHKTLSVRPSTQPVLPRVATTKHCLFGPAPNLSSQEWLPQNTVCSAQHPTCPPKSGYHKTLSVWPSTQPVFTRVATTKHCLFGPAPNLSSQEWLPQNTVCSAQHPTCPPKSGYHKTLSVQPSTQPVLPMVADQILGHPPLLLATTTKGSCLYSTANNCWSTGHVTGGSCNTGHVTGGSWSTGHVTDGSWSTGHVTGGSWVIR